MLAIVLGTPSALSLTYEVSTLVDPLPLISAVQGNSDFSWAFNPTWVQPSNGTGQRSGLLVRSQNCTAPTNRSAPDYCVHCWGPGDDKASFLTWAELDESSGTPTFSGRVTRSSAVFGPFDCPTNASAPDCDSAKGAEDPRLTYNPEDELYYLVYNADGMHRETINIATTRDPTRRSGWQRHGEIFPNAGLAGYKSGAILLREASSEHYIIWGCDRQLLITPSTNRDLLRWDYNRSNVLIATRRAPFWDSGFVEAAMPPLLLSTGDLLFFYDSLGSWNRETGYMPGWVVLNGTEPTHVLQRATTPPLPFSEFPWQRGNVPPWTCNVALVSILGGGHPIHGHPDAFRVYFGGADAVVGTAIVTVTTVNGMTTTTLLER